jgi:Protein of unknown function (DUF2934)
MTTRKTAAKTAKPAEKTVKTATKASKTSAVITTKPETPPSHEEIAHLARQYWIEGGHRDGHAEQDWLRAVQELAGK